MGCPFSRSEYQVCQTLDCITAALTRAMTLSSKKQSNVVNPYPHQELHIKLNLRFVYKAVLPVAMGLIEKLSTDCK